MIGASLLSQQFPSYPRILSMALRTVLPMSTGPSTPLRHPAHRSPRQITPSQDSFIDKWRNRMRSELVARVKAARQQSITNARGGEEEVSFHSRTVCMVGLMADDGSYLSWGTEAMANENGEGG